MHRWHRQGSGSEEKQPRGRRRDRGEAVGVSPGGGREAGGGAKMRTENGRSKVTHRGLW